MLDLGLQESKCVLQSICVCKKKGGGRGKTYINFKFSGESKGAQNNKVLLTIALRPGQTCHSKDGGSCTFHWRGRARLTIWDRVKIPRFSHKLMHRKNVTCELHDSYFRSRMIKTCHSKYSGSGIFRWPFMGRDSVDVELLYNSVHRKSNEFGDQRLGEKEVVDKTAASKELGPRASGWTTLENEKDTLLCPEELGRSICCSSVRSPTPSHTQPFQIM